MKGLRNAAYLLALAIAFLTAVLFSLQGLPAIWNAEADRLLYGTLARVALSVFLILLFAYRGELSKLRFAWKGKDALFCLLPLLVAVVNFPFSALLSGKAGVNRVELLPLFLFQCLFIGMTEELLFRGIVHTALRDCFKKHAVLLATVCSSAIFALWHLVNLFYGAGLLPTLLQVGYTFLIGAMLAAVLEKTGNLWLCVLLHALFDVGGTLIQEIGHGDPHDLVFWILTAVVGVACAIQIIIFILRKDGKERT